MYRVIGICKIRENFLVHRLVTLLVYDYSFDQTSKIYLYNLFLFPEKKMVPPEILYWKLCSWTFSVPFTSYYFMQGVGVNKKISYCLFLTTGAEYFQNYIATLGPNLKFNLFGSNKSKLCHLPTPRTCIKLFHKAPKLVSPYVEHLSTHKALTPKLVCGILLFLCVCSAPPSQYMLFLWGVPPCLLPSPHPILNIWTHFYVRSPHHSMNI